MFDENPVSAPPPPMSETYINPGPGGGPKTLGKPKTFLKEGGLGIDDHLETIRSQIKKTIILEKFFPSYFIAYYYY